MSVSSRASKGRTTADALAVAAHLADDARAAPLDHLEHAPLGAAVVLAHLDPRHHQVAVQRAGAAEAPG